MFIQEFLSSFFHESRMQAMVVWLLAPGILFGLLYGMRYYLVGRRLLILILLSLVLIIPIFTHILLFPFAFPDEKLTIIKYIQGAILLYFSSFVLLMMIRKYLIYAWLNDDKKYHQLMMPKSGVGIQGVYPQALKLKVYAYLFVIFLLSIMSILLITLLLIPYESLLGYHIGDTYNKIIIPLVTIAGISFVLMIFSIPFIKCPHCQFYVYVWQQDKESHTLPFFYTVFSVLLKGGFLCMHCGAQYRVSKAKPYEFKSDEYCASCQGKEAVSLGRIVPRRRPFNLLDYKLGHCTTCDKDLYRHICSDCGHSYYRNVAEPGVCPYDHSRINIIPEKYRERGMYF